MPKEVDEVAGYVPMAGAAEDIYIAYKEPILENVGWAVASTVLDTIGLKLAGKAAKSGIKGEKALYKSRRLRNIYNKNKQLLRGTEGYLVKANKIYNYDIQQAKKYGKELFKNQVKDAILNTIQNQTSRR